MLLSEYLAEVRARIERESKAISSGAAPTFEEYRHRCGVIAGLNSAIRILEDMVSKLPAEERTL